MTLNFRTILAVLALAFSFCIHAQNPAAQIKEIQKDPATYINAESTDPNEDSAYGNALRQMVDMANNFVNTNNDGAEISEAAIVSVVNKIVIPRGEFKRVFLYAKRDDLMGRSTAPASTEHFNIMPRIERPAAVAATEEEEDDSDVDPLTKKVQDLIAEQTEVDFEEEEDSPEEFEQSIPDDIVEDVRNTAPVAIGFQGLLDRIHNSSSLKEAAAILYEYMNRRTVSDYGVAKEAHNSAASFWAVEDNGKITVLGPEIRGHRKNYRSGKTDALHRYRRGVWFRKR